jgi:NAD+ kinase
MSNERVKIALYSLQLSETDLVFLADLVFELERIGYTLSVEAEFASSLAPHLPSTNFNVFTSAAELKKMKADLMLSIGGDGTMLRAATFIGDSELPLIGVNLGRLGFLATLQRENVVEALERFSSGNYRVEERSLLQAQLKGESGAFGKIDYALNEVAVSRKDTTSMITIETWLDGVYLTTYWADGLLIATPTGSTGYSLSCGGPVVSPHSSSFVVTPVAPHHLNARPLIIEDRTEIRLKVDSREPQHLVSLDSRISTVDNGQELCIRKAPFVLKLVVFEEDHFFQTLREKLLWGEDKRN